MPSSIDLSHPWLWLFFLLLLVAFANGLSDYTMFGRRRRRGSKQKKAK